MELNRLPLTRIFMLGKASSFLIATLLITLVALPGSTVQAQLAPGPDPITGANSTAQTLASGTGTVSATGSLSTSGAAIAITVTGNSTLVNLGTIQQTGTVRAIRLNTNNVALTLNNGASNN